MKLRRSFWFLGFSLLVLLLFRLFPALMDAVYSRFLYRYAAQGISWVMALLPFSLAELLLLLLVVFLLFSFIKAFLLLVTKPFKHVGRLCTKWLYRVVVGMVYAVSVFILTCGVHYHRVPLEEHLKYPDEHATTEELFALADYLVQEVNSAATYTRRNLEGDMVPDLTFDGYKKEIDRAYDSLEQSTGLVVGGRFPATKPFLASRLMSYAYLSGFFFPWTLEANINKDVPVFRMPAIMAHEQAHVRGFMRENEANFLTYLLARHTRSGDLKYSCLLLSFNYVLNALYKASAEEHRKVLQQLSPRVMHDLLTAQEYWEKYRTSFAETSQKVNNAYLKANAQQDGVASYGRVVDLMVMDFKRNGTKVQQNTEQFVSISESP